LFKGYEQLGLAGTGISPFWILLELKMMEVVSGDTYDVQSSSQIITTNKPTSSFYRPDVLSVTQPTVSEQ